MHRTTHLAVADGNLAIARICQLLVEGKVVDGHLVGVAVSAGIHHLHSHGAVAAIWAASLRSAQ